MPPIVIMKFGGTSVATPEGRNCLVDRVRGAILSGNSPVVVVSAMGRSGEPYATDTLLSLVEREACSPREIDVLMSVGETISAVCVANDLKSSGVKACALSGAEAGIITDAAATKASIKEIHTGRLLALVEEGVVPVVAGFQGIDEQGAITTLGRGGSDTTACALGVALQAESVDIYKDVDGIMTTDPKACPDARVLERITATELFEMATAGARIVHAPAAELALSSGVPMKIRNTFNDAAGTTIVDIASYKPSAVVTAVTSMRDINRIRVMLPYAKDDHDAHMDVQMQVFALLADAHISIDMFTPVNDRLLFSLDASSAQAATKVLEEKGFDYALLENLSKITVIGAGMHGVAGVMSRIANALFKAGVDVLQVSDSHATISVLVDSDNENVAICALHSEFALKSE